MKIRSTGAACAVLFFSSCSQDEIEDSNSTTEILPTGTTETTETTPIQECGSLFSHIASEEVSEVYLAGSFNEWNSRDTPMLKGDDGSFTVELDLEPGPYSYKFVEVVEFSYDNEEFWVCDSNATLAHCEDGYQEAWETEWSQECASGVHSACNSLIIVETCALPGIKLSTLSIDRDALSAELTLTRTLAASGAEISSTEVTIDESPLSSHWVGATSFISLTGLSPGRHTVRATVTDTSGAQSHELYVPFWLDKSPDEAWRGGSVYWAFVDRVSNGDASNDFSEATSSEYSDYYGGDIAGLTDMLPYLDDLGVTVLWITNMQGNASGAWSGDCNSTYSGYHGYWPDEARSVEEHFGSPDEVKQLVDAAHDRGMRVIMDWVGNHLHEEHPWVSEHPEWFNEEALCSEFSGDQANWDAIPESCWFTPYLPDIDYTQEEPLQQMVDEAMWWATEFGLDGFRVDAVKHINHAVHYNLASEIGRRIEHRSSGSDTQFWTVGETFDGSERIAEYISGTELDGQFDFPMYWSIIDVFGYQSNTLDALIASADTSKKAYGDGLMSGFLGNHDVDRFSTIASEGGGSSCLDGSQLTTAWASEDANVYDRLKLAWTWLFTQPNPPTIYYGDEIGMPGYSDPDNRQPLWWYTGGTTDGIDSVEAMAESTSEYGASVVRHVQVLANARKERTSFYRGTRTEWWAEPMDAPNLLAYSLVDPQNGDQSLVILNRSWETKQMTNGLSFAGLSTEGVWIDLLSGESFTATSDSLTVTVDPYQSRVLILKGS